MDNIIWEIIIEPDIPCNYRVNIEGKIITINLYLCSFNRINEYKTLALQALSDYKYQRFKVV